MRKGLFFLFLFISVFSFSTCSYRIDNKVGITDKRQTYSFKKLSQEEELGYKILRQNDTFIIEVYSTGNPSKVIFHQEGTYIDDLPLSYGSSTGMVKGGYNNHIQWIAVNIFHALPGGSSSVETWFIDGRKGIVKLLSNEGKFFTIDDSGSFICMYNRKESERIDSPVVTIYRISNLKQVNQGICNELHGDRKSPASMTFSGGVFTIEFYDDGPNEGKLELSIPQ